MRAHSRGGASRTAALSGNFNSRHVVQQPHPFSWKMAIHGVVRTPTPPEAPAAPTLSGTDGTSLTITWTAPASMGGAVTDYDVRYRRKGDTAWIDHPHDGTALTATVNDLLRGASWEAQVAASNATGPGPWSDAGAGHTGPARVPEGGDELRTGDHIVHLLHQAHKQLQGFVDGWTIARNGGSGVAAVGARILAVHGTVAIVLSTDPTKSCPDRRHSNGGLHTAHANKHQQAHATPTASSDRQLHQQAGNQPGPGGRSRGPRGADGDRGIEARATCR